MKKERLGHIVHFRFDSQYEVASTFMRLQEFYESPIRAFRGKYFSLETFMDTYAKNHENFTYTTDWNGFNVPGHIVIKFFDLFHHDLLKKEEELYDGIVEFLAHALYYLNKSFKKEMNALTNKLPQAFKNTLLRELTEIGYTKKVLLDEIQAYMSTSPISYLKRHDISYTKEILKEYRTAFKKHKKAM